jgi:vancomycin resistance protein YoaR
VADSERTDILEAATEVLAAVRRKRRLRHGAYAAGWALGLFVALYAFDLLISQGDVPRGVTVSGVDIGGLARPDAEQRLRERIGPQLARPVTVHAGPVTTTLDPATAGLRPDWASTVDQAGEQPLSPFTRLTSFFTTRDLGVVTRADEALVAAALGELRTRVDQEAVEGAIRFDAARPVVVEPRPGRHLDVPGATRKVLADWAAGTPLGLPVTTTPATVTAEAVRAALDGLARPAVSGPVVIHGEGADARLDPPAIAAALSFPPVGDRLELRIDHAAVVAAAEPQLKSAERRAGDARVVFSGGHPSVVPSVDGKVVDWDATLAGLPDVLVRTSDRELTARYRVIPAKVTTEQANRWGIAEVIGESTTGGFAADSGANIATVARRVDGAVVGAGETFSLNGFTGPRGVAQGYVEAGVIENGAPAREVGGGISQFATTLYNASYFAGLKDAGHREHSYYISRYPAAREATVFQNPGGASVIDLRFTNDAPTAVAIQTIWTPSSITVRLWGTKRYDVESITGARTSPVDPAERPGPAENCHPSAGAPGFTTSDTRVLREAGTSHEVRRETRTVRYNPQPRIVCP